MLRLLYRYDPFLLFLLVWQILSLLVLLLWPQLWLQVLLAVLASHLLVVFSCLWTGSLWPGPPIKTIQDMEEKKVFLTFDDGPDPETTTLVMDILAKYDIKASFFIIGERAEKHPEMLEQLVSSGHKIENHSWSHPIGFFFLSWRTLGRQIKATSELIEKLSGYKPVYFRAPAGIRNPMLQLLLGSQGLYLAGWTRRGYDTITSDAEKITRRLLRNVKSGDILLLHDGSSARDQNDQAVVITVLPKLLDSLTQQGFKVTHLPRN